MISTTDTGLQASPVHTAAARAGRVGWRGPLYHLWRRLQGDRAREALRASERWTAAELRRVQEARLTRLLLHAYQHVPYYRPLLLESGVVRDGGPPRIDLGAFDRIPVLTRAAIREHAGDLQDRRPPPRDDPRTWVASSGTTADPIRVLRDRVAYREAIAGQVWFDEWMGCPFGVRKVYVWGPHAGTLGLRARWRHRVRNFLKHEVRLQHYYLSDAVIDRYLERIRRVRPVQVAGWAGVLVEVARRAAHRGLALPPPRAVLASAEPLWPDMRETIERVFGAPVFNRYGAYEVAGVACECHLRAGLHVAAPTHYVEVLRPDGRPAAEGEVGEIVITLLTNDAMPLIRYRIGDLGALRTAPCPCGRPFPRLVEMAGRTFDAFVRPDGQRVHGVYVRRFYRGMAWIRQFQVVQLDTTRIHVRLVDAEPSAGALARRTQDLAAITAHLRHALGADCEVTFEFVDRIPAEPSGKYRGTVSRVAR